VYSMCLPPSQGILQSMGLTKQEPRSSGAPDELVLIIPLILMTDEEEEGAEKKDNYDHDVCHPMVLVRTGASSLSLLLLSAAAPAFIAPSSIPMILLVLLE
jgi:hypothetical protein